MDNKKQDALTVLFNSATAYKRELAGNSLLFICMDKGKSTFPIEVDFHASSFLHRTGVKLQDKEMTAADFYDACVNRRLNPDAFDFANDGTTELKLRVLPTLICKNLSANMLGDYNSPRPKLYTEKIAGNVNACMGFVRDGKTKRFAPNTVLYTDIRQNTKNTCRIIATYRKPKAAEHYSELVYAAKKIDWKSIAFPEGYTYLPIPQ